MKNKQGNLISMDMKLEFLFFILVKLLLLNRVM